MPLGESLWLELALPAPGQDPPRLALRTLLSEVLRAAWVPADRTSRGLLGPVAEELLIDHIAWQADGPLLRLRGQRTFAAALAALFAALGSVEISPARLSTVADRLQKAHQAGADRVHELARLYHLYRKKLGPGRLDPGLAFAASVQALADPRSVEHRTLSPSATLRLRGLVQALSSLPSPSPAGLLSALAALVGPASSRRDVRLVLPALFPSDTSFGRLDDAVRPLLETVYAQPVAGLDTALEIDWVSSAPPAGSSPAWSRLIAQVFGGPSHPLDPPCAARIDVLSAASSSDEHRHAVRRIQAWLAQGISPADIAVTCPPDQQPRLSRLLHQSGIPVCLRPPAASADPPSVEPLPPPLLAVLSLYRALQAGFLREPLLQVLTSTYFDWRGWLGPDALDLPQQLLRALRGAGVRVLSGDRTEIARRIHEWLRQSDQAPAPHPTEPPALRGLHALMQALDGLPSVATVAQHASSLSRFLHAGGFVRRTVEAAPGFHQAPLAPDLTVGSLVERDRAAGQVLLRALSLLPRWADELKLSEPLLDRDRFARLLKAVLLRTWPGVLPPLPDTLHGVELGPLPALSDRPHRRLLCIGLSEASWPVVLPEDPLFHDDLRRACNRLLARPVFPLAQRVAGLHELLLALHWAQSDEVVLSYARTDGNGRTTLPTALIGDVLRVLRRPLPQALVAEPLPSVENALRAAELWALFGAHLRTPTRHQPLAHALIARDRTRAQCIRTRLAVDAARHAWFSAQSRPAAQPLAAGPGPFGGELRTAPVIASLLATLPGTARHPLSASAIEDYARCPFRFFVGRVLRIRPTSEGTEELDVVARGRLYHRVLELFFVQRRDAGQLPLRGHQDPDEQAALRTALDTALAEFATRERTGHPRLLAAQVRRLHTDLSRLIDREAQVPVAPGCQPALFEHKFGPLAIPASDPTQADSESLSDAVLHIAGIVDRIDIGPGRAVVLDYKSGSLARYAGTSKLLHTVFQLPLYAAALSVDPHVLSRAGGHVTVSARYYAVRQASLTPPLTDPALLTLDPAVRREVGDANAAESAYHLWQKLRQGDFRVAPRTCEGCQLHAVCRIGLAGQSAAAVLADANDSTQSSVKTLSATTRPEADSDAQPAPPASGAPRV